MLRDKGSPIDWGSLQDDDIDIYSNNNVIHSIATACIPNKYVHIKLLEPPWISLNLKRHIRKRKQAYKKAKRTNLELHWKLFKKIRNKVTKMIRESKESHYDKIAEKLKSSTFSAKDWWKTLKTFILPSVKTSISPLEVNNEIFIDECDKANILNISSKVKQF